MKAAEAQDAGLLGRNPQAEFLQPLDHDPIEPMGIVPILEGTDIIIGVPNQYGLATATRFDYTLKPEVKCIVQVDVGQYRGDDPTLRAAGYRVQNGVGCFAFSGDTTSNDGFWEALNRHEKLDLLIVESAFPDQERELSIKARHYCPQLLANDLKKLRHRPALFLTHMKPGSEDAIVEQCREQIDALQVQRLCGGDRFKL